MSAARTKLEQSLALGVLCLLLLGCLLVLLPFASALLWGVVLTISCWPLYQRLLRLIGNRRTLASALMMVGMMLIILLPFAIVGLTLADNVSSLTAAVRRWLE